MGKPPSDIGAAEPQSVPSAASCYIDPKSGWSNAKSIALSL